MLSDAVSTDMLFTKGNKEEKKKKKRSPFFALRIIAQCVQEFESLTSVPAPSLHALTMDPSATETATSCISIVFPEQHGTTAIGGSSMDRQRLS